MEHNEKLCDEMEGVRKCTHLGERVNACGGCEAAMIAKT